MHTERPSRARKKLLFGRSLKYGHTASRDPRARRTGFEIGQSTTHEGAFLTDADETGSLKCHGLKGDGEKCRFHQYIARARCIVTAGTGYFPEIEPEQQPAVELKQEIEAPLAVDRDGRRKRETQPFIQPRITVYRADGQRITGFARSTVEYR